MKAKGNELGQLTTLISSEKTEREVYKHCKYLG